MSLTLMPWATSYLPDWTRFGIEGYQLSAKYMSCSKFAQYSVSTKEKA